MKSAEAGLQGNSKYQIIHMHSSNRHLSRGEEESAEGVASFGPPSKAVEVLSFSSYNATFYAGLCDCSTAWLPDRSTARLLITGLYSSWFRCLTAWLFDSSTAWLLDIDFTSPLVPLFRCLTARRLDC